jgi:hypothetical protein
VGRLLPLLQVLLLLCVFLLQPRSLLLVLLFQLLRSSCVRVILRYALMFLLLPLLQFLVFLILLLRELRLLLLILLVARSVPGARNSSRLVWLQFFGVGCRRPGNIVLGPSFTFRTRRTFWTTGILRASFTLRTRGTFRPARILRTTSVLWTTRLRAAAFWRMVRRSSFPGWHSTFKLSRSGRGCYRRSALID